MGDLLTPMGTLVLIPLVLALAACSRQPRAGGPSELPPRATPITGADQLVAAMRDRYAGTWYRNLTFIQTSTYLRDGAPYRTETWYEAAAIPGRLRIDLGEPSRGDGVLYRNDSVYSIQGGRLVDRRAGRNLLMVLGFDVYGQPAARTIAQLRAEGINASVLHRGMLDGKRVYVVGAGPGDSTSNQFWVEADRMLFVRLIQTDTARKRTQDVRFDNYVQHGGGWVAEEVRILLGGRMIFHEQYSKVRVNVPLDSNLFVPEKWAAAKHWYEP